VNYGVVADTPLYAVFLDHASGRVTHVAFNPAAAAITASFSDGIALTVPSNSIASEYGVLSLSSATTATPVPVAPSLSAIAPSPYEVDLSWTAGNNPTATTYSLFRETTPFVVPTSSTLLATSLTNTSYKDESASPNTAYFYLVCTAALTNCSNQANATTWMAALRYINAGGSGVDYWSGDEYFSGGTAAAYSSVVDTSLIPAPTPPQAVYQTERNGPCNYSINGFVPGSSHIVQLHFAETYWTTADSRQFNVVINGIQVLTNFDIVANTGAPNKAIEEDFSTTASASGQITIAFTTGRVDVPKVNGIVIF
jgi:hypothetical protein